MDDDKVAILLENLMAQFRTFGEGLDGIRDEMNDLKKEVTNFKEQMADFRTETNLNFKANKQEHQQIILAVQDLDSEVKRLDTEVIQIKRVK